MTFPLPGWRPWGGLGGWRLVRRGEEEARGLRKEEAEVVLRKPGELRKELKLQFSLRSRSEEASRAVVVVA